jgi:protein-S-isoprenylcysteine O-methyltransferase Ste14
MKSVRAAQYFLVTLGLFLGLPLLGWGMADLPGFFAGPPRWGYAAAVTALGLAMAYAGRDASKQIGGGTPKGIESRLVRRQSFVRFGLVLALLGGLFLLPYADRRALGVLIDQPAVRWVGVGLFGAGSALVFWTSLALGRLYSPEVTVQQDHQLITHGPYRYIRHPRYLGGLVYVVGLSLVFRSWIGLLVSALALGVFWFRIRDEEALMHAVFGPAWEAYCRRTWRLIPLVY